MERIKKLISGTRGLALLLLVYAALINLLIVRMMPIHYYATDGGALVIHHSWTKQLLGNVLMIPVGLHVLWLNKQERISSILLVFVDVLYFLPGVLFILMTRSSAEYLLHYCAFWVVLVIAYAVIPNLPTPRYLCRLKRWIDKGTNRRVLFLFIAMVIGLAIMKGASFSKLLSTNVYGNRLEAREVSLYWVLNSVLSAAGYFLPVYIGTLILRRENVAALLLVGVQLLLYTVGSERIFLVNLLVCILIGLFHCKQWHVLAAFSLLCFYVLWEDRLRIPPLGRSLFMRYAIIPNEISKMYYEYFSTHEPDWLRSVFPRIARALGTVSPYQPSISRQVGAVYFQEWTNANNGLIGGGMGNFGHISLLLTPVGYALGMKLIDWWAWFISERTHKLLVAFVLILVVIDNNQFFATFFTPSVLLLFTGLLALIPRTGEHCRGGIISE